ncbi:MAG: hypothetical protein HY316_08135 [Acidobacteria bacterium]|nr:hypothetical protein [Acidobacteriota bacterium]
MKGTRKDRRSRRIPATHRLLLTILGPTGSEIAKEIVSTVELSQHGARVRGRRLLRPESEGMLTQLSSGRQARIRIAWQQKSAGNHGFLDSGVELLSGFDYWGISFAEPAAAPASPASSNGANPLTPQELLQNLKEQNSGHAGAETLQTVWCALMEQLEERKVISRDELIASVRSIALSPSIRGPGSAS